MDAYALLASHHLRPTSPRVRILQMLEQEAHLSPEAVYHRWAHEERDLSLATVYRTFAELCRIGLLERHLIGRQRALYTLRQADPTALMRCRQCGSIVEFTDSAISTQQQAVAQRHGYQLQHCRLTLDGLCQVCRNQPGKSPG
ncbi:Fur family transcriptional regulator [Chitinimonas sp.]|uniref:Fur family transcriptional regulator n=1 Tax=Chitinimonas sp. TaxID=1934313 RepID=UPI002F9451C3